MGSTQQDADVSASKPAIEIAAALALSLVRALA